jgi:hypothetical protein
MCSWDALRQRRLHPIKGEALSYSLARNDVAGLLFSVSAFGPHLTYRADSLTD